MDKVTGMKEKEMNLTLGVKTILLSNLKAAMTIEARKHQYNIANKISEALHEIFVQYVWIAHCILLLPADEQPKIADAVHVSLDTCYKVEKYIRMFDNIPDEYRPHVMNDVERKIIDSIVSDLLSAMEKVEGI